MKLRSQAFTLALVVVSAAILWGLQHYGLLDVDSVLRAYRRHYWLLAFSAACVMAGSTVAIGKHLWALSVLKLRVSWIAVAAANVIGQAIGIWAPGNLAVMEALRIGLLVRPMRGNGDIAQATSRMAMASLFDRTTSVAAILLVGAMGSGLALAGAAGAARPILAALTGLYLIGGLLLAFTPQIAATGLFVWLADRLERPGGVGKARERVGRVLRHMHDAADSWRLRPAATPVTAALATVVALLTSLTLWCASLAIGHAIPFTLIMALYPSSIIGAVFPIGIAGLGGPQLLAIAVFAPFGIDARVVATMTLLQSTLTVAVQTLMGLAWAAFRHQDVVDALWGSKAGPLESGADG